MCVLALFKVFMCQYRLQMKSQLNPGYILAIIYGKFELVTMLYEIVISFETGGPPAS